jgi:peptidoglycan/xylan/chitin deacetylase (PgdA/CDA1 family)
MSHGETEMNTIPTPAEPIIWPDGKKAAAAFTFDVDGESPLLTADEKFGRLMGLMSHQAYGPLVGVPRILDILRETDVRGSFYVPGYIALRYPEQIKQILTEGHEIGHHGHLHEQLPGVTREEEQIFLDRGFEALRKVAGVEPKGYRAPLWELNWRTPEMLGEAGFLYDTSLMDADVPYELAYGSEGNSLVEIPINWILDDWNQYAFIPGFSGSGLVETPQKAIELFQSEFDAMREDGGCFVLTCHPFLSGRPGRARALRKFIEYVKSCDDVWLASMEEIAAHVRAQKLKPRLLTEPDATL